MMIPPRQSTHRPPQPARQPQLIGDGGQPPQPRPRTQTLTAPGHGPWPDQAASITHDKTLFSGQDSFPRQNRFSQIRGSCYATPPKPDEKCWLTVASWLIKAEIVSGETSMQPGWFLLIFLTLGSVALLWKGIRDLLKS